ncbi:Elongator complex protein 5 [Linum grandiflorum]
MQDAPRRSSGRRARAVSHHQRHYSFTLRLRRLHPLPLPALLSHFSWKITVTLWCRGLVLVSYSRSPSFYLDLFNRRGGIELASSQNWIYILDCYTDPLGWKHQLVKSGIVEDISSARACVLQDVKDVEKLHSLILESGTGLVGQGKVRFSVAIDSITEMRRHVPVSKIAGLISDLRSNEQISSIFWLLHSDIHELKLTTSLEYLSSMVASVESLSHSHDSHVRDLGSLSLVDNSFGKGKLHTRFKRRNGRVRIMNERFHIEESGIKFTSVTAEDGSVSQGLVPKVQFNLELSEKEKMERAKVVLPFEHQGTGKPIQIYDGRKSLAPEGVTEAVVPGGDLQSKPEESSGGGGEIIYFRDSDDERPDSDEDPDDDLDI